MAFFALLWKSRKIEKYRLDYEKEKINSIVMGNTHMEQTLSQKWRHYRYDTQKRISRTFKKWYPEGSGVANFFLYLKTDQTFPNFLLKSLMGFVGGIILTYLCFMFFVFQLSISLIHATIMSSIIGVLLTLGLAFSYRIRCLVFLLIPQLFSRVGRYTLTCYALVLILTGPATNTLKNSEVLSESMACTQEQIKISVHHLDDLMKKPYNAMKYSIQLMIKRFQVITAQVKRMVIALNRLVLSIVGFMQYSFSWLQSMSNICNARLGTPYKHCTDVLKDGINDCRRLLGPEFSMLCNMTYLSNAICNVVKPFNTYCYVTDFMDEAILASIRKKLKNFTATIRAMFQVEIHIHHSYSFRNNSSRTASQVAAGIVTEIRNMTGPLLTWLSWSSCVTSLFLLLIIFRAKYYQHMYETRSRFDNLYVTKELQELDLKRQRQGRETVLPLNSRERAKYITTTSFRLVTSEKVYLTRSAVYMAITTFKLLIHMVADYSLYWVLITIRHHGKYQSSVMPGVPHTGAYVTGDGFVARLFRSIVEAFNLPISKPVPSVIPCLPDPYIPDFKRYTQIGVLIFLMWFFALFEPYGLRMRHLIMAQYRPERAKARATWLYNHILRTRAGFMKFARRKLHREYKYSTESVHTFSYWLVDHIIPFQCLKYMLGIRIKDLHCLLCGTTSNPNDTDTKLTRCETPKCPGVYCSNCFSDIGQMCTICLSPADYGDLSDASLEKGSSDDSDSESEYYGAPNADDKTRLIKNVQNNDTVPRNSINSRKWKFFGRNTRRESRNNNDHMQHTNYYERSDISCVLNNGRLKSVDSVKLNKLQGTNRMAKSNIENVAYNCASFYNNNKTINVLNITKKIVCKTKSQGVETKHKHRSVFTTLNFNRYIKVSTILIYKKQLKPPNSPESKVLELKLNDQRVTEINSHKLKYDNVIRSGEQHLNKITYLGSLATFQNNSMHPEGIRDNYTISAYNLAKGLMQVIRFFVHNNNNVIDSTNRNKKVNKNKIDNTNKFNNMKPLDNSTPKDNTDRNATEGNNKPKKVTKDKTKKVKIKGSRHRLSAFHSYFANHWQYIKSNIVLRTNKRSRSEIVGVNEKKNHKRRKKRKDEIIKGENNLKSKKAIKENKCARNYRISAFLADRDWMKRDYNETDNVNKSKDDSCRVALTACRRRLVPVNKNPLVAMVQLANTPFQWRNATREEYCVYPEKLTSCTGSSFKYGVYKQNAIKALQRLRDKVSTILTSPPSSLVHKMLSTVNISQRPSYRDKALYESKRASFYRAFRDELMHPDPGVIDTDVLFRNQDYREHVIPLAPHAAQRNLAAKSRNFTRSSNSTPTLRPVKKTLYHSNSSEQTRIKTSTTVERCKCDDLDYKHSPHHKISLVQRLKKLCSSLFSPSSIKSCKKSSCDNAKERLKQLAKARLCGKGVFTKPRLKKMSNKQLKAGLHPKISPCREKCLPPDEFKKDNEYMADAIIHARTLAKCREIELAKIQEIQRHIEKEREIERELIKEQERHKEKEREIEMELGMELARHREKEQRLMCDEDIQTLKEEISTTRRSKGVLNVLSKKKSCNEGADKPTKPKKKKVKKEQKLKVKMEKATKVKKAKVAKVKKEKHTYTGAKEHKCIGAIHDKSITPHVDVGCECYDDHPTQPKEARHKKESPKAEMQEKCSCTIRHWGFHKKKSCVCKQQCIKCCTGTQHSGDHLAKLFHPHRNTTKITCSCATQYSLKKILSGNFNRLASLGRSKRPLSKTYSPVCVGMQTAQTTPSPLDDIPFMRSNTSSPGLSADLVEAEPSSKHSMIYVYSSPTLSKYVQYDNKPKKLKHTSVQAELRPVSTKKKSVTTRTCRVKDVSVLTTGSNATVPCDPKTITWVNDSPNYSKCSPVLSKHSIGTEISGCRKKNTSVLAKLWSRSISPHVKTLSTITTLSPLQFTKMTDKMCSPTRVNRSTLNILQEIKEPDKQKYKAAKEANKQKQRTDKHTTHKATHCNYRWKISNDVHGSDTKYAKQRKLSLESSLYDADNTNIFNDGDVQTTTSSSTSESSKSNYSLSDDESVTDTTFCSLVTVNYTEKPLRDKYRTRVVTKANQSTSTEKARLCDTGTTTYDWWSPMVDKRESMYLKKSRGYNFITKQRRGIIDFNENKKIHNRALTTDGKIVKFKSKAQIIPTGGLFRYPNDAMSPSRYLLESQKYYNELFAYNMRSPRIIDCAHFNEKPRTSIGSRRTHRRAKRLHECYSPRRQNSPRKRNTDSIRTSDSPRKRPYPSRTHDHRRQKIDYAVT